MVTLLIDPHLLELPDREQEESETIQWLISLEDWLIEIASGAFDWALILECVDSLSLDSTLVSFHDLRNLANSLGYPISPNLLGPVQKAIQSGSRDFARNLETTKVIGTSALEISPNEIVSRGCEAVQGSFLSSLTRLAIDKTAKRAYASQVWLASCCCHEAPRVQISGMFSEIQPSFLRQLIGSTSYSTEVPLAMRSLSLTAIPARQIVICGEVTFSRQIQRIAEVKFNAINLKSHVMGTGFWASVTSFVQTADTSVIENLLVMCAAIVSDRIGDIRGARVEQVRTTRSGSSPQRVTKDGAKHWRVSLSMGGPAWRMHYWVLPADTAIAQIEFDAVLRHSDPV